MLQTDRLRLRALRFPVAFVDLRTFSGEEPFESRRPVEFLERKQTGKRPEIFRAREDSQWLLKVNFSRSYE